MTSDVTSKREFFRALASKLQDLRETDIAGFLTEHPDENVERDSPLWRIENLIFQAQNEAEEA